MARKTAFRLAEASRVVGPRCSLPRTGSMFAFEAETRGSEAKGQATDAAHPGVVRLGLRLRWVFGQLCTL